MNRFIAPVAVVACSIRIHARPETVYEAWCRVDQWSRWDSDTRAAQLDGALKVGAAGSLTPRKGRKVRMEVVALDLGRRLEVRCPVLGSALHFDHAVESVDEDGCAITHRAWFSGWLKPVFERTIGRDLQRNLPRTLASLKRYVEEGRAIPQG